MSDTTRLIKKYYKSLKESKVDNIFSQVDHAAALVGKLLYADFASVLFRYNENENFVPLAYYSTDPVETESIRHLEEKWCTYPIASENLSSAYDALEKIDIEDQFARVNNFKHRYYYSCHIDDKISACVVAYWYDQPHFNRKRSESLLSDLLMLINDTMGNLKDASSLNDYFMRFADFISMFEWPIGDFSFDDLVNMTIDRLYQVIPDLNYGVFYKSKNNSPFKNIKNAGNVRLGVELTHKLNDEFNSLCDVYQDASATKGVWIDYSDIAEENITYLFINPLLVMKESSFFIAAFSNEKSEISRNNKELLSVFSLFAGTILENSLTVKELNKLNNLIKKTSQQQSENEAMAAMTDMASGLAHDFNNMIGGIIGRLQLMQLKVDDDYILKNLNVIESLALEGAETLKRIQEFATGIKKIKIGQVYLSDSIRNFLEKNKEYLENVLSEKDQSFDYSILENKIPINGSDETIEQILRHLIDNAAQFGNESTKITLKVSELKKYYHLKVSNEGDPIDPAHESKIYYPFFSTKESNSAGLGLATVFGLVSKVSGKINYSHDSGITSFNILFPKLLDGADESDITNISSPKENLKIMVVDDDEQIREVLTDMLTIDGHKITACKDGFVALEKFKSDNFDLIITDLGMPGMSGLDLAATIHKEKPELPIAMITGWGTQLDQDEISLNGVKTLISKPFHLKDIKNMINELVK